MVDKRKKAILRFQKEFQTLSNKYYFKYAVYRNGKLKKILDNKAKVHKLLSRGIKDIYIFHITQTSFDKELLFNE